MTGTERIARSGLEVGRGAAAEGRRHRPQRRVETHSGEEHVEIARHGRRRDGTHLTFAVTDIRVGPLHGVRERTRVPTLLRLPAEGSAIRRRRGDFTAGDLKPRVRATVLPGQTVAVGAATVPAIVIRFDQDVTGEYPGSRTERFRDADDGLILRRAIDSTPRGSTNLDFTVDQTPNVLEPPR